MKLYIAATFLGRQLYTLIHDAGVRRVLLPYPYIVKQGGKPGGATYDFIFWAGGAVDGLPPQSSPRGDLFIDSGAFSADTLGIEIDEQHYYDFVNAYRDRISVYAGLDVIGDADATFENHLNAERAGLAPITAYHLGEPIDALHRLLDHGVEYLALGGTVHRPKLDVQRFEEQAWSVLSKRTPLPKVHAFGCLSLNRLAVYPYYSADSTKPIDTGSWGGFLRFEASPTPRMEVVQGVSRDIINSLREGVPGFCDFLAYHREKEKRAHIARRLYSCIQVAKMERYLTALWTARGVTWEDDHAEG